MILREKLTVMQSAEIERNLRMLAEKIIEHCKGCVESLYLIGIRKGGDEIAVRLKGIINEVTGFEPELGIIDITLYRDDVLTLEQPQVGATEISGDVNGKIVVLIDDVLYSGRTVRAALDLLTDYGRPKAIRLAVLVDRGLRELPIQADFAARVIPTSPGERVEVVLDEDRDKERVVIYAIEEEQD